MQCIYNYAPETNHVPTVYHVAAILLLQYMAHVTLSPTINPLHCTTALLAVCAVLNVLVLFSSGTSCFPDTLLGYCTWDFVWVQLTLLLLASVYCVFIVRSVLL